MCVLLGVKKIIENLYFSNFTQQNQVINTNKVQFNVKCEPNVIF